MMFKKIVSFISLFLSLSFIYAYDGVLSGSKGDLKVIKTEYFDVIYPEEAQATALKIASVCDGYYLDICSKLQTKPYQRFPVTITPSVEQLNAYYTAIPYNRIVLYDTKPETSLDMYQETMCSVFYHELTHAVTWNMKSTFWRGMSYVFGDVMNPAWLTTPTFWSEGATVSFESKGEGGRLNDPFAVQLVNSYKIDGDFPGWRDVTGARDTYPGGTDAYMFGGTFAKYLQEKYGMEKYGDFWRKTGSISTVNLSFRSVYGRSVSDEWEDFEKTIYVPQNLKDTKLLSSDLSYIRGMDYSYNNFPATKAAGSDWQKVVYYDAKSNGVFLIDKGNKPEKILTITGIFDVKFHSLDKNKIRLRRYVDRDNVKEQIVIYDLETHDISYSDPDKDESRFESEDPGMLSENQYFCSYKDGLTWKVIYRDGDVEKQFDFSKVTGKNSLVIHNFQLEKAQDKQSYIFTWAELGKANEMMSRIGRLVIDSETHMGKLYLEKEDDFGGVTDIAFDGERYYAVLQRSEGMPLVQIELDESMFEEFEIGQCDYKWADFENERKTPPVTADAGDFKIKSYNPFAYAYKGIFAPFSMAQVYSPELEESFSCPFGVTFLTSNPWGDKIFNLTGGYNPFFKTCAFEGSLKGGNDSFAYTVSGQYAFIPQEEWKQSFESLQMEKVIHAGKVSSFGLNFTGKLYNEWSENRGSGHRHNATGDVKSGIYWSTLHKSQPDFHYNSGFNFMPFIDFNREWSYHEDTGGKTYNYVNSGAQLGVQFPVIVPWIFNASIYPEKDTFASGSVTAILYDFEIQKGIPCTAMFINRLYISATYQGKLSYDSGNWFDVRRTGEIASDLTVDNYKDVVSAGVTGVFSPNFGFFCGSDASINLSYVINYYIHNKPEDHDKLEYGFVSSIAY